MDYTAATGTLTFLAGSRREVIEVATIEDQEGEADETFRVELSGASGAILGDGAGTGTIIDDDGGTRHRGHADRGIDSGCDSGRGRYGEAGGDA